MRRASRGRGTPILLPLLFFPILLLLPSVLPGESPQAPEMRSFSGSPLLLEIRMPQSQGEGEVERIRIAGGPSELVYRVEPPAGDRGRFGTENPAPLSLRVSPFLQPGTYDLRITLERGDDKSDAYSYEIGFVDFVWGRDNFRFGNNADYESRLGDYSQLLDAWLDARFGGVDAAALPLLVDYMYGLFGKNAGRCYAFTGTQLRYWRAPDLLPSPYESTYEIRRRVRRHEREMLYLQFDIVYDQFLSPEIASPAWEASPDGSGPPALEAHYPAEADAPAAPGIVSEVASIMDGIDAGVPVVVGMVGAKLHHSMLAYGYIRNRSAGTVTLLMANNWKSEQNMNIRSLDAENLIVRADPRADQRGAGSDTQSAPLGESQSAPRGEDPPAEPEIPVLWRHVDGVRERRPERIFVIEVKERYSHEESALRRLIVNRAGRLRKEQRGVVVVENARFAWMESMTPGEPGRGRPEEEITGYRRGRIRNSLKDVSFDRVQRTFRFEFPSGGDFILEFVDDEGSRVLGFFPLAPGEGAERSPQPPAPAEGLILRTSVAPKAEETHRRLRLGAGGWEREQ